MTDKQKQLFILPYAGGSRANFKRFTDFISNKIDVITVEYAGRGSRVKDPLANSFNAMLDDARLYCQCRRNPAVPYAIMGYSMGSILAYEMVLQQLLEGPLEHLFIAAEVSPRDRDLELRKVVNPTDERIIERARRLGGLQEKMLNNQRFSEVFLKPLLSDYRLFCEYRFSGVRKKISVDTTLFYCQKDTPLEEMEKWNELIDGKAVFHEMGENHFFINQYYAEMARIVNQTLIY